MATLILDTSHKFLVVGVAKEDKLIAYKQSEMKQKQSEYLINFIEAVLKEADIHKKNINTIVLTDGPGSYTGLRIAMTFTKVFALTQNIQVYTINTLLSLAGNLNGFSLLDARSKRVFGGFIADGKITQEAIYPISELTLDVPLYGDGSLLGKSDHFLNIAQNILDLRREWIKVDNVDTLSPRYLK